MTTNITISQSLGATMASSTASNIFATNWAGGSVPYTIGPVGSTQSSVWPQTTSIANANGSVHLLGDEADLIVNGKSILKTINALEQRIGWFDLNPAVEKDWNELKQLGDQYRKLEAQIVEKMKVWTTLQKTTN